MKKFSLLPLIVLLLSIFPGGLVVAQTTLQQSYKAPDCYTNFIKRGNSYIKTKSYDLAIQQFKAAKYCVNLRPVQRRTLDSLIQDATIKSRSGNRGTILKRF